MFWVGPSLIHVGSTSMVGSGTPTLKNKYIYRPYIMYLIIQNLFMFVVFSIFVKLINARANMYMFTSVMR